MEITKLLCLLFPISKLGYVYFSEKSRHKSYRMASGSPILITWLTRATQITSIFMSTFRPKVDMISLRDVRKSIDSDSSHFASHLPGPSSKRSRRRHMRRPRDTCRCSVGSTWPHFQVQPACRHLVALSTIDGHSRPLPTLLPTRAHREREQFKISTIVYLIIQADVERSIGLFEVTARG